MAVYANCVLIAGWTQAADKPHAHTQPATHITGTSAVLHGMVNPNLESTTAWFEWGTDSNLIHTTLHTNLDPGNGDC